MDALPIAAVISRQSGDADVVLSELATSLRFAGWRVRGLLQEYQAAENRCQIHLINLDDGTRYPITQNLGPGSESCRLDASKIAEASGVMRRIADQGADLVIFNRFGGLESKGGGFCAEMLTLMSLGIPVLAIVSANLLTEWRTFSGNYAVELAPDITQLKRWFFLARNTQQLG